MTDVRTSPASIYWDSDDEGNHRRTCLILTLPLNHFMSRCRSHPPVLNRLPKARTAQQSTHSAPFCSRSGSFTSAHHTRLCFVQPARPSCTQTRGPPHDLKLSSERSPESKQGKLGAQSEFHRHMDSTLSARSIKITQGQCCKIWVRGSVRSTRSCLHSARCAEPRGRRGAVQGTQTSSTPHRRPEGWGSSAARRQV